LDSCVPVYKIASLDVVEVSAAGDNVNVFCIIEKTACWGTGKHVVDAKDLGSCARRALAKCVGQPRELPDTLIFICGYVSRTVSRSRILLKAFCHDNKGTSFF